MSPSFDALLTRIEGFIKRYYLNLLIKGGILFGAGFLILFLLVSLLEYFGYFGSTVRLFFFYGFLVFNIMVFLFYVVRPMAGFLSIGKRISPAHAAKIIGNHFKNEISDKITNALELQGFLSKRQENYDLVIASVEQKSQMALVVPFSNAIDLKANYRLVPYFLIPFLVAALAFFAKPGILLEPANRIANYNIFFEKPAPFSVIIQNPDLLAFKNQDFYLEIVTKGQVVPGQASVRVGYSVFLMNTAERGTFSFQFRNLQESISFFIEAEGFTFGPYQLEVIEKPSITHFSVTVSNPAYTKLGSEVFNNIGDLIVAEGATIQWQFHTRGGGGGSFRVEDQNIGIIQENQGVFTAKHIARETFFYNVSLTHHNYGIGDSLKYFVQVLKDAWPQITVEERQDSVLVSHLVYKGQIEDDYGFTRVEFRYRVFDDRRVGDEPSIPFQAVQMPLNPASRTQVFFHHFDLNSIEMRPGQSVESYFVVFDNDRVNGPKYSSSRRFLHRTPTREELIALGHDTREEIKEQMTSNISSTQSARQEMENIRKGLLQNPNFGWEQQRAFQKILQSQQDIKESFEKLRELEQQNEARQSQFNQDNEHLMRQKEELEKVLDEIRNSDLADLMEKIQEMLQNLDREMVFEMLNNMEFQLEHFQHQMNRALEFYKRLELEYLLQESMSILDQTINDQQHLIQETQSGDESDDVMKDSQEGINQNFENVSKLLEEFRDKNQELRRPQRIDDTRGLENQIQQALERSLQGLKQNNPGQSLPNQQRGQQGMEQLSQRLTAMQQSMFQNQQMEDARALRQILENLLKISFSQEHLMHKIQEVNPQDPRYLVMIQDQRKIEEDLRMVNDSLVALSVRQPQINTIVTRELQQIQLNLSGALRNFIDRHIVQGSNRQQFVMTHVNNLALLLNEALQDMQMQMQGGGSGDGSSAMPSGSIQDIGEMQQRLNQILEQLQQGHQPSPGEVGEQRSLSEQLARAAAQQEAIRNRLGELLKQLQDLGYDVEDLQLAVGDMERTETDIVNRQITRQTIDRQNQIHTRLLKHERAILEREMEERRDGTTANDFQISNPESFFEYNRNMSNQIELMRRAPTSMSSFYKRLVERYLINLE